MNCYLRSDNHLATKTMGVNLNRRAHKQKLPNCSTSYLRMAWPVQLASVTGCNHGCTVVHDTAHVRVHGRWHACMAMAYFLLRP